MSYIENNVKVAFSLFLAIWRKSTKTLIIEISCTQTSVPDVQNSTAAHS